jgi:type IV secretory pathway VirB10-like protein
MKAFLFLLLFAPIGFCQEVKVYVASWPVIEASILLDGKLVGQTPAELNLKAGRYKFLAKKEGWIGEEREVIIEKGETSPVFINLSMKMVVSEKPLEIKPEIPREPIESVLPKKEEKRVEPKVFQVEPEKIEPKAEERMTQVANLEEQIERPKEKALSREANELISKAEGIIEKAEEEGAERYAKKSFSLAKRMLREAKKEVSAERAKIAITEAEKALKETLEKRKQYDSGYISGLIKDFGR